MSCVNVKSPAYKELVTGLNKREKFIATALISKFMTENDEKLPTYVELKSLISDHYNSKQGGIDYKGFYSEVREMFKKALPNLTDKELDDKVKFIDKLDLIRMRGGKEVLSSFINGVVYVANSIKSERGDKAYTDVRHEIFHTIFNNYLGDKEQEDIMESFKRWKPEFSSIQDKEELEERMAEAFEQYRDNPNKSIPVMIKEFFKNLLQFLGFMGKNYSDVQRLFSDVENGKFTRDQIKDSLVTRDKNIISKHDEFATDLDLFLQTKAFVLNALNELMFPLRSEELSEQGNEGLFLDNQGRTTLYNNNKDQFKLGLTKNDALKELQNRIKTLRNNPDPNLSRVLKVLSNRTILKDLFDYLQPFSVAKVGADGELTLENQVEEDPTIDLLEDDEEIRSLEIGDKQLINPVTKISEVVKDFLSSIAYRTNGDFVNIDPGAGFVSLLNLLGQMYGNGSIADNLESMRRNFTRTSQGNTTKAVFKALEDLHNSVLSQGRIVLNIQGVAQAELDTLRTALDNVGIRHQVRGNNMTLLTPEGMKIENKGTNNVDNKVVFSFNRFAQGGQSFLITQGVRDNGRKFNESNKSFIQRVSNQTGIPTFVVAKLFKYNEDRNQLAEVTKVANSLRKLSPKFVKVTTERKFDLDSGMRTNVTSFAFIDRVSEYRESVSIASVIRDRFDSIPIRQAVANSIARYRQIRETGDATAMRALLKTIVVDQLGAITDSDFTKIKNKGDVPLLLNNLERVFSYVPDMSTEKVSEDFNDSDQYLKHTSNFANLLQRYAAEKNSPTGFRVSTSNKQKWENVMKNSGYMIFKNLEDFATGLIRSEKLLPFLKNSFNNYLKFNPIFQHNYFTGEATVNTNMLKVGDDDFYADHQETYFENKSARYEKPPVPFSKETPRDWINRNFLAMFQLPILEDKKRSGLSYFQQKFQPESAPNVSVVKMGLNNAQQLQNHFMSMILQEAYMNHLHGQSLFSNLRKNTQKSKLPGLEGRTYFIENSQNKFFNTDGSLKEQYGRIVDGKLQINTANSELRELHETMMKALDNGLDKFVDTVINEKATLEGSQLVAMYDKIASSYSERYRINEEERKTLLAVTINAKTDIEDFKKSAFYAGQREVIKKALSAFYLNSYVNGKFMNQLSSGATENYKNSLDEIKRQAGVNAMNDTGLVDDKHGISKSYKNVVISGANNFYGQSHRFASIPLLERFFRNKKQEVGDAQSWDIPEYKDMLRKSFGKSVDMGVITKDVHFEVNENGGVDYRKTSSAELTNELVKDNKTLRDLRYALTFQPYLDSLPEQQRDQVKSRIDYLYNKMVDENGLSNVNEHMEYQDILKSVIDGDFMIHKASFDSAIKGSKPSNLSNFTKNQETGTFDFNIHPDSILKLNSAYTGIQQAIRHRYIDSFISHFTQLTYLIGLNRTETSIKNNKIITKTLSKFAKAGMYDSLFDYRMGYDNEDSLLKVNNRSKKEFISDLIKKLDLPGNERIVELLNTPRISMNNPLFSEKLMQSFFNSFTKKTVAPKHPGGSFVLQSEFGFDASRILSQHSLRIPEFRPDLGYAECYLPEMYQDQINAGDMIYYGSEQYNKMFGFRIPSSDLHSSVPLKVIGYYPSSAHDNVIVIPSAVTALHGSDFDVDKLFVVRQGVFGHLNGDEDPKDPDTATQDMMSRREYRTRFQTNNTVIGQKGVKYGFTAPNAVYNEQHNITSFGDGDQHTAIANLDSTLLDEKEKTQQKIIQLETDKTTRSQQPHANRAQEQAKKRDVNNLQNQINDLNKHLKVLRLIQKGLYSNQILNSVLDNIDYTKENAEDILYGITFDPVKGYDETSEYSKLAKVYSDIAVANGEQGLRERPALYTSVDQAKQVDARLVSDTERELRDELGVDLNTPEGQTDLLSLVNEQLKDSWVSDRDEFLKGNTKVDINRAEQHVNVHKETYMAAGLVGLIANFSKGLAYAFHGITDNANSIKLDIAPKDEIIIDGQNINTLELSNSENIKTQEIRSLALNAAIDHVKEQILNVLNVGNKTAKIFLAGVSTKMTLHQTTMIMLQPAAKELNGSNATTVQATLNAMANTIIERLNTINQPFSDQEIASLNVTTPMLEQHVKKSFSDILNDNNNPQYRNNLLLQYKVIKQLSTLDKIGSEISDVSNMLNIIQGLPHNLESAYERLKTVNKYINVANFYNKLQYSERSEYDQAGFKDNLRGTDNILSNVNLANNENVLGALEAIKMQLDVVSELFTENSLQAQFVVNTMIKAVSDNSDPSTLFTGENDANLTFDTTSKMTVNEKYLKGKGAFNMFRLISRNIFNYLTSGLNISYNQAGHLFSLGVKNQKLLTETSNEGLQYQLNATRSFVNSFLMKEGDAVTNGQYNGDVYIQSQINPNWRIKPLTVIKRQNIGNKFLDGLGVDINYRDRIRVMNYNSSSANSQENLAEVYNGVHALNTLGNIYVQQNEAGQWVDVPSNEHPVTEEMGEVIFNILKASMYTDKFKFSMSKATNVIPAQYFQKVFQGVDTLVRDLFYYNKNQAGNKYYKDFSDLNNQSRQISSIANIKENLFINTIFSIPTVLPNVTSILPSKKERFLHLNRQTGILPNGNIYDLYLDASALDNTDPKDPEQAQTTTQMNENSDETPNTEVTEDIGETEAESDLFDKFRKNPSFMVNETKKRGNYEIFMKVGETGDKQSGDQKLYYKRIGFVGGKVTNNSFDPNLLLNQYKISDYFNPKRLAIPVGEDIDLNASRVRVQNAKISDFMINAQDDQDSEKQNPTFVAAAQKQQFDILRAMPENVNKSDEEVRQMVRTRVNVQNVINSINEVSLYDSRNIDRVGLKTFKVISKLISADGKTINLELEALASNRQLTYNQFQSPFEVLKTLRTQEEVSREQKINKINSTPGMNPVTSAREMTDAEIDLEYRKALELQDSQEINNVLKDKYCN